MAMQPLIEIQQGMVEIGRIRLGDKVEAKSSGRTVSRPRKLTTFRLTSASKRSLDAAAKLYGGTVEPWNDAPAPGYFQLLTQSNELRIAIPPVPRVCSQHYEFWQTGGCARRCDGTTEMLSGEPCKCTSETPDKERCKITTRLSVVLPELPGLGLWRLESHGWNAAKTLPGTIALFASTGKYIPAVLRAEQRKEVKNGQTRQFVVPVIDLPEFTLAKVLETQPQLVLGGVEAPAQIGAKVDRPALPSPPELGDENPSWEKSGPKRSESFRALMGALQNTDKAKVNDWKKKNQSAIDALETAEQRVLNEEVDNRLELPF